MTLASILCALALLPAVTPDTATLAWLDQPVTGFQWYSEVGDVDADGDNDLVLVSNGSSTDTLWLHRADAAGHLAAGELLASFPKGTPTWEPLPDVITGVCLQDVDGDDDLDVIAFPLAVLRNDGQGSFGVPEALIPANPFNWPVQLLGQGDVNGDGRLDLVLRGTTSTWSQDVRALLCQSDGTFKLKPPAAQQMVSVRSLADVNGDGLMDLIGQGTDTLGQSGLVWYRAKPGGSFKPPKLIQGTEGFPSKPLTVADMNADGLDDALCGDHDFLEVWINQGMNTLQRVSWVSASGSYTTSYSIPADMDGDGHMDVVIATFSGGQMELLRGDGQGDLTPTSLNGGGATMIVTTVTDWDADGRDELIGPAVLGGLRVVHGGPGGFVDLGLGDASTRLSAEGATSPGSGLWITVDGPSPHAFGFLLAGTEPTWMPFAHGVLAVQPQVVTPVIAGVPEALVWPGDLEAGATFLGQAWMLSPTGALLPSNVLAAVQPQ